MELILVTASIFVAGTPDEDPAVGIKAGISAPQRVNLSIGKTQIVNLRAGIVQNLTVPFVP